MEVAVTNGVPLAHVGEYFGLSNPSGIGRLTPLPEGFDKEISSLLEEKFIP